MQSDVFGVEATNNGQVSIPDLRIDIGQAEERYRRALWASFMDRCWCFNAPSVDDAVLQLDLSCWLLDGSMLGRGTLSGGTFRSTRRDMVNCFLLRYQRVGDLFVRANGKDAVVREGALGIIDLSMPLEVSGPTSSYTYLVVNASAFQLRGAKTEPVYVFDHSTAGGRLIISNFLHVAREAEAGTTQNLELITLLTSLIGTTLSGSGVLENNDCKALLQAKKVRAERYLLERQTDEQLNIGEACSELGMSRATLYRLFQDDGGVQAFFTRARLNRVFNELEIMRPMRGVVSNVSTRYGFYDQSHFSRLFRRAFGASPSEVLGSRWESNLLHANDPTQSSGFASAGPQKFMESLQSARRRHVNQLAS